MAFSFLVQETIILLDRIAHALKPGSMTNPSSFRFCLRPFVLRVLAGIFNHPYHSKGPVLQPDPDPAFSFHLPACFHRVIQQIGQNAAPVEESALDRLQDIIESAGELERRVNFDDIVMRDAAQRAYEQVYAK